jgi:hypothetical protein
MCGGPLRFGERRLCANRREVHVAVKSNGENYSCKILTQALILAGQASGATVLGITSTFGTPSTVSDCGGLRKSNDGAAGVRLKFSA